MLPRAHTIKPTFCPPKVVRCCVADDFGGRFHDVDAAPEHFFLEDSVRLHEVDDLLGTVAHVLVYIVEVLLAL
jgi:hypothetical protein